MGIGTCVQTMDSAGVVVAATVVDDGNLALCHWFLLLATSTTTASDGDKVKAYCAGLRGLTTTTATDARDLVAATVAGTAGVVTLTGAQALAAGAIAFGAAALAF